VFESILQNEKITVCLKIYSNNIKVMFFFGKHTSGHMLRGEKRSFLEL
jgi:hypothetical protein